VVAGVQPDRVLLLEPAGVRIIIPAAVVIQPGDPVIFASGPAERLLHALNRDLAVARRVRVEIGDDGAVVVMQSAHRA
jgi:hypothetical protein